MQAQTSSRRENSLREATKQNLVDHSTFAKNGRDSILTLPARLQKNYYGVINALSTCSPKIKLFLASETLSGVYKFELMRYVYIYIYMYGGMCAIIVAHAT